MHYHELPELHGVLPELHNIFPELYGVLPELHERQPCTSKFTYLQNLYKTCFKDYMAISHVIPKIHEFTKIHFPNHITYFWNYMVDNHVNPKLHTCKISAKHDSRITWSSSM
jgi:hypothetical protein